MKLSKLLTIIAFLTILAMATHMSIDSDTWWHLRSGQWMVENRSPITEDSFSFTRAGTPWQYPGLWIQVAMYFLFDTFGPGGLNFWVSLSVVAIFFIVWKTMNGSPLVKVLVLLLAAASSAVYWAARPYLVTYLLAALFFLILQRYFRDGEGNLWLLPVLMVVWVNSHGGFLAGFLILAPYIVDAVLKWVSAKRLGTDTGEILTKINRLMMTGALMLAATMINPSGYELWTLPFSTVSRQAEKLFIAEWQSPDFHQGYLIPFGLMLVLLVFALGSTKKKFEINELLLAAGFGLLGLYSVRNIFFFVIVAPSILAPSIDAFFLDLKQKLNITLTLDLDSEPGKIQNGLNFFLVALFSLVVAFRVWPYLPAENNWEKISEAYPVEAAEYIRAFEPEGNIFNSYNFGGYLIWSLPEYPVFVDGRADLHQDEIILEWYRTANLNGDWEKILEDRDIGVVLLEPGLPLVRELQDNGWQLGYEDELSIVLIKD